MIPHHEPTSPPAGSLRTYFAPAERMDPERLRDFSRSALESPLFQAILESVDGYLMILNPQRQVLAINQSLLKDLKIQSLDCMLGNRPGEILGCIHAAEEPAGCGTSKACATCGAVISILESQQGHPATNECLATVRHGGVEESHEFSVRATPVRIGEQDFTVLVLHDISGEKRRAVLERTFFHDIMNTVGGLMGWSSLMQHLDNLDPKEAAGRILQLSNRLKQEIEDQRRLMQAENGSLDLEMQPVSVREILDMIRMIFNAHDAAKDKKLEVAELNGSVSLTTDPSLLERILTNMIKNALEAGEPGQTVRVWFERRDARPTFFVHNPGVIPEQVQLQLFKRSFSTKGAKGRGIGTYSMKLFGERYLGGHVDFESSESRGTIFRLELPPETIG